MKRVLALLFAVLTAATPALPAERAVAGPASAPIRDGVVPASLPQIQAAGAIPRVPASSEFLVSPANFEVAEKPQDLAAILDELRAIKDPVERDRAWLARTRIDRAELSFLGRRGAPMSVAERDAFAAKLPGLLRSHLLETLAKHEHERTLFDGAESYRVKDGLAFWADFATPDDPDKRLAAQVFLQSTTRRHLSKDQSYRLVAALTGYPVAVTRLVDAERMTPQEWRALGRVIGQNDLSLTRVGRYGLAGSGAGFHMTKDVLVAGQDVKDQGLTKKLARVLAFLAGRGVNIAVDENVGAAAFFNPLAGSLNYVMPSRVGLNTFSHEGTHARFERFQQRLKSWAQSRKLAIPYEVDGPFVALLASFGGFMNLLNELNSWRTGEAFDGGKSDEDILKILRDSYGLQAGAAAAALFSSLWPASRVAGVSVSRLILRAVRQLNGLDAAGLTELAHRSDEPSQMNFLRLLQARYDGAAPAELSSLAQTLAEAGASESVRRLAKRLLAASERTQEPANAAKAAELREYRLAAGRWIESFQSETVKVIPFQLHFASAATIRFAEDNGLFDYEETIRRMQAKWDGLASADDEDRALFAQLAAEPGSSWKEKLESYLAKYNATGFEALWNGFQEAPTYNLHQLLVQKHAAEFKPEHVRQLARWAVETGARPELQAAAAPLLADLMDALGLPVLFEPEELKALQAVQRDMNRKASQPIEAHVPLGRAPDPGRWLFSAVDEGLAEAMFDGKPGIFRLKAIEVITQRTYPEELPRLRARLLQVIADPKIGRYDQWVARMFLIPAANQIFPAHAAWGETVAQAVLADPAANATALEFVGEFYRLRLGATFRGPAWGTYVGNIDAGTREQAEKAVAELPPEQKARYERALDELWRLLGHPDPKVRASALYAVAFRPVFLLGLEDRLAATLRDPSSPHRPAALKLAGMASGFSPKLDSAKN